MPVTIIYDTSTHHVAIIDPPLNDEGQVILPEGGSYAVRTISDTEAAKLTQPGSFTVDVAGTITVTPPTPTPPDPQTQADQAAYEAISAATSLDQVKTAILAWMAARPGISVPTP